MQRAAHGLAYGLLTDGRRAGFGQTWTSPDVPRWAAADCAAHGLETDWRRVRDNARGCLRTLRVRLTPNLPSESIRFLRHIYHEYAQRTTHGRATDSSIAQAPHRARRSPRALIKSRDKAKETPVCAGVFFLPSGFLLYDSETGQSRGHLVFRYGSFASISYEQALLALCIME